MFPTQSFNYNLKHSTCLKLELDDNYPLFDGQMNLIQQLSEVLENGEGRQQTFQIADFSINTDIFYQYLDPNTFYQPDDQLKVSEDHKDTTNDQKKHLHSSIQAKVLCPIQYAIKNESTQNIPKFIYRIVQTYFQKDSSDITQNKVRKADFKRFFRRAQLSKHSPNLKLLEKFLNKPLIQNSEVSINRIILRHILKKRVKDQILTNKKIVKKSLYLIGLKLYRLRCRSSQLIKRSSLQ